MKISNLELNGLKLIHPDLYCDNRGFFLETYQKKRYEDAINWEKEFIQDNMSYSVYGTIRGLHFQSEPYSQSKLVRCVLGRIIDVAVDLRFDSSTFGKHVRVELNGTDQKQLYIPSGFAHGFSVLSSEAVVEYKCDSYYNIEAESGIRFDDPDLGIDWMIEISDLIISAKDRALPLFGDFKRRGTR